MNPPASIVPARPRQTGSWAIRRLSRLLPWSGSVGAAPAGPASADAKPGDRRVPVHDRPHPRRRFHPTGAAFAAALGLALAGCARPEAGTAGAAAKAGGPLVYPASDYAESAPGTPGGMLRVSVASDTTSLDLHAISHTNAQWLGRLFFDNLVYLDAAGNPSPWLATSWEISPDGLTYTFHLRRDVTFSDGARFDAEAVRVNLEHMRDPATKSPLAAAYIAPYRDGEVVDAFTFRAHLREPYAPFLHVLAQSWLALYSPKAIRENPKALAEHPVGSGPFVLESYTRQQGLRVVRRPDYAWAPPVLHHAGPAYLERIEIDFVAEALVRYSSLAAGQYDLTIDAPPQNAAAIRADPRLGFDSRVRTGAPSRGIAFNTERAPFDDVRVRRALALATDRDGIARIVGFGEFRVKTDFLASNTRDYDPSFENVLRYDPVAANALLDEAGWIGRDPDGIRTKAGRRLGAEYLVTEAYSPGPLAVALQSDFQKIGFDLRITQLPLGQISQRRYAGDYDAIIGGVWHTNTPDVLYILHHSDEITSSRRIGQNTSRLRDALLDDLLLQARHAPDPEARRSFYRRAQQRLVELVPAVPLYENHTLVGYNRERIGGLAFDTSHNTVVFTSVWLKGGQ